MFFQVLLTFLVVITEAKTAEESSQVVDLQELLRKCSNSMDSQIVYTEKQSKQFSELMERLENSTLQDPPGYPRDCSDVYKAGIRMSGVYRVKPTGWPDEIGFEVFCDMDTDGGGWTVVQRRGDFGNRQDYFFQTWSEYQRGFGLLEKEFWIGNDRLSSLTTQRTYQLGAAYELRLDMTDLDNRTVFAKYEEFRVEDRDQQYQLRVEGYSGTTGGDSMATHNGMKFSTKDKDNDKDATNCAMNYKGGWWYNYCYHANLNGLNRKGDTSGKLDGIVWHHRNMVEHYSLSFVEMKIRPRSR